ISTSQTRAVRGTATPIGRRRHGWAVGTLAVLALLSIGSSPAAAQTVITGGPTTAPGGGWTCTAPVAGTEKLGTGGNYSCSGTAGSFSNLYIGINKSTTVPFGDKMNSNSAEPSGAEMIVWSVNGATTIRYTATTGVTT